MSGKYLAGLAIVGAVFLLLFLFVYADRGGQGHNGSALTEQVKP